MLDAVISGDGLTDKEKQFWEKTKYRDKLILLLLVTYGLRLSELQQLSVLCRAERPAARKHPERFEQVCFSLRVVAVNQVDFFAGPDGHTAQITERDRFKLCYVHCRTS